MPDNYHIVKENTLNLLKNIRKDKKNAEEYKSFMGDILRSDYAEKVPSQQLHREDHPQALLILPCIKLLMTPTIIILMKSQKLSNSTFVRMIASDLWQQWIKL